jgi:hypothetical protein
MMILPAWFRATVRESAGVCNRVRVDVELGDRVPGVP